MEEGAEKNYGKQKGNDALYIEYVYIPTDR